MFEKYLKQISKYNVFLIKPFKKSNILQNPVIFWYSKINDLIWYKYIFLWKLYRRKIRLENILKKVNKNKFKLSHIHYKVLIKEIRYISKKIDFLEKVYDFEANKIDKNYNIVNSKIDYDYYNKKFFWVTKKDICIDLEITSQKDNNIRTISKKELKELLNYTVDKVEWFKYKFWSFVFMSHSSWVLNIPTKKEYTNREVITLFFHEMTHFFRRHNNLRNFWTIYWFSDYMKLEEWFALYNEYYYGKKIIKWLKYNPYYEACFAILLDKNISEKHKKEKIYDILKHKWYDNEKAESYYYRFHRYTSFWSKHFFLKDLVYTKWYKLIKKLIKNDPFIYDIIFSWKIWMSFIKKNIYYTKNSFDTKSYFDWILSEIKIKFNMEKVIK